MKIITVIVFLISTSIVSYSQTGADAIIGKWLNPDGTRKMEIYKTGSVYFGKLIWMSEPSSKAKVGDLVLQEFSFSDGKWKGKVVARGDIYSGTLKLDGNELSITASSGFLSKTKKWTRTKN